VRKQTFTFEEEAGFLLQIGLIILTVGSYPRLHEGKAVVSGRNIHSSLVYQGIVGGIGLEKAAQMNSAALIPDLCIWVDCDPEIALERI
jgi:Thymidylate kinase